jgi:protein SCO1/2
MPPSEFRLRDQDGRWTSLDQYRGKPVVVTFLYTSCKDTCPLIADQIRGALDRLGPNAPPAVAISTDPAADNPTTARAFLIKHHLLGRMRYLVGTRAELQPVWKRYAIQPQTPEWEHSAYVFVLDGTGRQRVTFPADRLTPEALAHDIRVVQSRQS